ncbi:hypothetical protein HPULCUR_002040 [Helicostylum pulchrum]|uniref:CUE domain-containing protein n=1 Tax=Helicostylum pulchrum TaxID=562976 RepID=A0ABP9XPI2_9FUNG
MTMLLIDGTEEASTMEQDLENICIPFESRPGTDITSKLLLNNQTVMDLVINSLLDMNPPDNQYFSDQTEWTGRSKSDVLYVSKTETTVDLPPILNKERLGQFFEEAIEQVQQIVKNQKEKSTSTTEKDENIVEDLLRKLQSQKMKMKAEDEEKDKGTKKRKRYIADDFLFIESISQPNKPKQWKRIFNEGKARGFFESYTSANSLKSSYHHSKKRIQDKK